MARTVHLTPYQHTCNLDVGFCEYVYDRAKLLAKVDRWHELMIRQKSDFKPLFQRWLDDYENASRYYISRFNNQKFLRIEGLVTDFLKVYLLRRDEDFDYKVYLILDEIVPMPPLPLPPEPEPPPPPCCPICNELLSGTSPHSCCGAGHNASPIGNSQLVSG